MEKIFSSGPSAEGFEPCLDYLPNRFAERQNKRGSVLSPLCYRPRTKCTLGMSFSRTMERILDRGRYSSSKQFRPSER
jgi:hypothetical protein